MVSLENLDDLCLSAVADHLCAEDIFNLLGTSSSFGIRFASSVLKLEVEDLDPRLKNFKGLRHLVVRGSVGLDPLSKLVPHLPALGVVVVGRLLMDSIPSQPESLKQLKILNSLWRLHSHELECLSTRLSPEALLFLACELGYSEIVARALADGASWRRVYGCILDVEWEDIRTQNISPLMHFCYTHGMYDNEWRIRRYVEAGGNLNAEHSSKTSPLMIAVRHKDFSLMKTLVELGASPNPSGDNTNPALVSILENDPESLLALISYGLDVNQPLVQGNDVTLLKVACYKDADQCVRVLLDAGAYVDQDLSMSFFFSEEIDIMLENAVRMQRRQRSSFFIVVKRSVVRLVRKALPLGRRAQ